MSLSKFGSFAKIGTRRVMSTAPTKTQLYKPRLYKYAHEEMSVHLISYSEPTALIKESNVDNLQDLVAYCARVNGMNKCVEELKSHPFSTFNTFYGIHGNHRNRDTIPNAYIFVSGEDNKTIPWSINKFLQVNSFNIC